MSRRCASREQLVGYKSKQESLANAAERATAVCVRVCVCAGLFLPSHHCLTPPS